MPHRHKAAVLGAKTSVDANAAKGDRKTGKATGHHRRNRRRALREYFETFIENEIDVLVMPALTRREWAELGVPLEHRARIKQAHRDRYPELWAPETQ